MLFSSKKRQLLTLGLSILALLSPLDVVAAEHSADSTRTQIQHALAEIERSEMAVIVSYSIGDAPPVTTEFGKFRDDGIPAADTQVDLLSITKSLTAISILKLVEQGKLKFTDTIDLHFPNVPEDKIAITVHQLLTHSSGLLNTCGGDRDPLQKSELLRCAFDSTLLVEPGSEYNYSNVGYSVLAAIIEERTGKSFERYFLDDVVKSVGLGHTGYESAMDESLAVRSRTDQPLSIASWGGPKPYWNLIGNGGLVSTPDEFLRIRQALKDGQIVSLQLLEVAHTAHVPEDASGATYYGYGVVVQNDSSLGPLIWHDGGNSEFSSEWNEIKEFDLTIFTAGYQTDGESAYSAIKIIRSHLAELRN